MNELAEGLVQSRIKESQQNVEEMFERVGNIVVELESSLENARYQHQVVEEKKRTLIESC